MLSSNSTAVGFHFYEGIDVMNNTMRESLGNQSREKGSEEQPGQCVHEWVLLRLEFRADGEKLQTERCRTCSEERTVPYRYFGFK